MAGTGHVLGLDDIANDRDYQMSVRCHTVTGTLQKINAKTFLKLVENDEDSFQLFQNTSNDRGLINQKRIDQSAQNFGKLFKKGQRQKLEANNNPEKTEDAEKTLKPNFSF